MLDTADALPWHLRELDFSQIDIECVRNGARRAGD